LLFSLLPGTCVRAQVSENMTLLGSWDDPSLANYSDIWGYASGGKEYALFGSRFFVHIVDVTNPANPVEIHRVSFVANSGTRWRDIKVYGDYAYCVADEPGTNEGLQVIALANMENTNTEDLVVFSSSSTFGRCHNLFIDDSVFPVKLYAFGTNTLRNGYYQFSLADPANPVLLASPTLTGGYVHDGYAINDTLYANSEGRGMYVYDVSTASAPVELGILSNYLENGYNHSVWRTANGRYAVMCDETLNTGVKIVDVQDPMDMEVVSIFRSTLLAPTHTNSIAHNPLVLGDSIVVLSYYEDGVQVWDISDPMVPTRLGYYDTQPNSSGYSGSGNWGAYPFLPSGNILSNDIANGLSIVRLNSAALPVTYENWSAKSDGKNALLEWAITAETDNAGWSVEHAVEGGQFAEIAFVASGETENMLVHQKPGAGLHYYRLRQRDFDGTEHLSEVRSVTFDGRERQVATYPNPAAAGGQLTFQGLDVDTNWELFSAAGRLVQAGMGRQATISGTPGVYLLKVEGEVVDKIVLVR